MQLLFDMAAIVILNFNLVLFVSTPTFRRIVTPFGSTARKGGKPMAIFVVRLVSVSYATLPIPRHGNAYFGRSIKQIVLPLVKLPDEIVLDRPKHAKRQPSDSSGVLCRSLVLRRHVPIDDLSVEPLPLSRWLGRQTEVDVSLLERHTRPVGASIIPWKSRK